MAIWNIIVGIETNRKIQILLKFGYDVFKSDNIYIDVFLKYFTRFCFGILKIKNRSTLYKKLLDKKLEDLWGN